MRIQSLLDESARSLEAIAQDRAYHEARLLLAKALQKDETYLIREPDFEPSETDIERFQDLLARRLKREPMAYILGVKEFFSLPFFVGPGVLIPRPESEALVEACLAWMKSKNRALRVLELGVGSACLILSLAKNFGRGASEFLGLDISEEAMKWAEANRKNLDLPEVQFHLQSMDELENLGDFDLILSNPPYIPSSDVQNLEPGILAFEPKVALDGGSEGIDFYAIIFENAWPRLRPGGLLALETYDKNQREILQNELLPADASKVWIEDCHLLIEKKD